MNYKPTPICFVLMPFGRKRDQQGRTIDFDAVYQQVIAPAIVASGMQPLRADQELSSGMIHKEMFERLLLSEVAVVDISALNANVYYELGIRHAVRQQTPVIIGADDFIPPFDLNPVRIGRYQSAQGHPAAAEQDIERLAQIIERARGQELIDSPVFQLLDLPTPDISRLRTDAFREKANYDAEVKSRFAAARKVSAEAVEELVSELGQPEQLSAGLAGEALLSLRAVGAWPQMVELSAAVAPEIAASPMFVEQRSLALARLGEYQLAADELQSFIQQHGGSSERYGILGGIYKRQWQDSEDQALAQVYVQKALDAYLSGFKHDWRDAYPGINYLTVAFIAGLTEQSAYQQLLPVVGFAIQQRLDNDPDFWDFAAGAELAALRRELDAPANPVVYLREAWEGYSAARTLEQIAAAGAEQQLPELPWLSEYIATLRAGAQQLGAER
jgi:hypothetical protein